MATDPVNKAGIPQSGVPKALSDCAKKASDGNWDGRTVFEYGATSDFYNEACMLKEQSLFAQPATIADKEPQGGNKLAFADPNAGKTYIQAGVVPQKYEPPKASETPAPVVAKAEPKAAEPAPVVAEAPPAEVFNVINAVVADNVSKGNGNLGALEDKLQGQAMKALSQPSMADSVSKATGEVVNNFGKLPAAKAVQGPEPAPVVAEVAPPPAPVVAEAKPVEVKPVPAPAVEAKAEPVKTAEVAPPPPPVVEAKAEPVKTVEVAPPPAPVIPKAETKAEIPAPVVAEAKPTVVADKAPKKSGEVINNFGTLPAAKAVQGPEPAPVVAEVASAKAAPPPAPAVAEVAPPPAPAVAKAEPKAAEPAPVVVDAKPAAIEEPAQAQAAKAPATVDAEPAAKASKMMPPLEGVKFRTPKNATYSGIAKTAYGVCDEGAINGIACKNPDATYSVKVKGKEDKRLKEGAILNLPLELEVDGKKYPLRTEAILDTVVYHPNKLMAKKHK